MWKVTWKSVTSHKLRLLGTSLSIALGVAFVSGALMLGATMNKTFSDLFANAYRDTDAVVRGYAANVDDTRPAIDAGLTEKVKTAPGVENATADVNGFAQLVDPEGQPVKTGGAPQFGAVWSRDAKSVWKISKGAAPATSEEVVVDAAVAKRANLDVGDRVAVLTKIGPTPVTISGVAKFASVDSPAGSQWVLFNDLATAQRLLGEPGKINAIDIRGTDQVSQQQLVDTLKPLVGAGAEVVTGKTAEKEDEESIGELLGALTLVLTIFGGIALFVAAFIINNTFSIVLAQRSKEMALLRAIGATRRQVLRSVMAEATITGLFASVVGLLLGILVSIALQALLQAFGAELPTSGIVIPGSAVVTALVAGTLITVVSAYLPARRSSKIPPIAALREVAVDDSARSIVRAIFGFVLVIIGVGLLSLGLTVNMEKPYIPVGAGAALVFIGVYLLGPIIARPASRIIGWPLPRLRGQTGHLARENAMRNPRRTSSTAAALMIGVALVTLASVFFTSLKTSFGAVVDRSFGGDFVVSSDNFQSGVPLVVQDQLLERKEIGVVAALQYLEISKINGGDVGVSVIDPKEFDKVLDVQVQQGDLPALGVDEIAISEKYADQQRLSVGSRLRLDTAATSVDRRVGVVYKDANVVGNFVVSAESVAADRLPSDSMLLIDKADGVSDVQVRDAVQSVVAPYLTLKVQDGTELKKELTKQIDGVLTFFYILLGLAIFIALIGIANTLALSVFERTRELGLLRAVGMTRRQMRTMVRWESVIVALLGTVLGLVIGVAFGSALVRSARSEGLDVLDIPWLTVVIELVVAAVAGVLAAILPARRAARIDILKAIATD